MKEYLILGSVPGNEHCSQVGDENYQEMSRVECRNFINLLRKKFGSEPEGARLSVKSFPHDFGTYREVVCYYSEKFPLSSDYCFNIEANLPLNWED